MSNARKSLVRTALLAFICWGMLGADAEAQTFLRNRDFLNLGHPEAYLNYGRKEYDPYPAVINARNRYDRLGNYLSRGFNVFTWEFSRPGTSNINTRTAQYLGWFTNLVMLNDSYKGWNYRVTLGEDIRAKFSDLTFSDPRFFGILLDGASSDNKFTLMLSQGGDLLNIPKFSTFKATNERSPVLIFGGHWETKLGNVLKMGATYFNQHMANTKDANGSFLKGDTPYSMLPPSFIEVIIEDDSPDDVGNSATIYDVDIMIIGESQGQRVRLTSIEGDDSYDSDLKMVDPVGGLADGVEVSGVQRVVYRFKMPLFNLPDDVSYSTDPDALKPGLTMKSVRFVADIKGDYKISVRQQHLSFSQRNHNKNVTKAAEGDDRYVPGGKSYVNPFTGLKGDDAIKPLEDVLEENPEAFKQWPVAPDPAISQSTSYIQYKWDLLDPSSVAYTVLRSDDTGTGRKMVEFDYGIPTGQALYGLDWDLTLKGLEIKGELVTNPQYFLFPVGSNAGKRFDKRALGYFLTAQKELGPFEIGAEAFNMDPDFSGNYDSIRGGVPFFSDDCVTCPQMQEMFVMTDNDDNDQWPDEMNNERPSAEKADSGIFPGLDENNDLIPDSDQNFNGIADWTEPILFYDADPPEFIYGIDFNNNGVVDYRENDALPDYPYPRDRQGFHFVATKKGLGRFGKWASVGYYSMKEPAGGGEANAAYARYEHAFVSSYFGKIRINEDIKVVKDDIRDDVYIWKDVGFTERLPSPFPHLSGNQIEARDLNSQLFPPDVDPLTMRNSLVNTLFFGSTFKQISGLNIINNIQWIRNSQSDDIFDDGIQQTAGVLSTITMVNKLDYTISAGNLSIRPMFKHLLLREHSDVLKDATGQGSIRSFSIYAPILRTRFDLTPKSNLQLGFQGLPFWRHTSRDRVNERNDFKEWTMVLMMSNRSDHYGYNLASQFGLIKTNREFDDDTRSSDSFDNSRIFFDIVAGF
ncbi:MAG TPA: hypothetical protein EYG11_08890 [Candidatus Latescibacteria bacterium]|nr:hypothetical protein [Candidatus Handelsmanbacteria bacterium]HIL08802.1 hypothetical protein [Candidatus Latescibacterota bacterium]